MMLSSLPHLAIGAYRAMTPSMRRSMFNGGMKLARSASQLGLSKARAMYRSFNLGRHRVSLPKMLGQGRIQNWKQIKQTGTGKKIHRRGRKSRYRRRRALKRYRIRKRKFINFMYRNRPPLYYSYSQINGIIPAYNLPIFDATDGPVYYPEGAVYSNLINTSVPNQVSTQHSDYILYKKRFEMFFHFADGVFPVGNYSHAYVRVLIFRKWGSYPEGIESNIWSMFKYPYILTSGYVQGFRRRWLKQFGAQLYSDKLLRISEDTKWTTEYKISIYPNEHTRFNSVVDTDHYYYQMIILGGFGVEDKYDNLFKTGAAGSLTFNYSIITTNYWKFVSGMPINSNQTTFFTPNGLPSTDQSNRPRVAEIEYDGDGGTSGNDPAGETGASGSTTTPAKSILHDDI